MKTIGSLSDLASLLPEDRKKEPEVIKKKLGYDGKPQIIKIMLETKGRGGKAVTVLSGFQSNPKELDDLCKALKKTCGSGGTVRDNCIEVQGDHRNVSEKKLIDLGYTVKVIR